MRDLGSNLTFDHYLFCTNINYYFTFVGVILYNFILNFIFVRGFEKNKKYFKMLLTFI